MRAADSVLLLLALASLPGCVHRFAEPRARAVDLKYGHDQSESRTLSALAALELAVAHYRADKGAPPPRLSDVAPRFLPKIPPAQVDLPGHGPNAEVAVYAAGEDPGRDTGGWGYRPATGEVFVDCTHLSSRGKPWNRERGAL